MMMIMIIIIISLVKGKNKLLQVAQLKWRLLRAKLGLLLSCFNII